MKFEPNESDYNEYVENVTPTSSAPRNCLWAFIVGGIICTIGCQGVYHSRTGHIVWYIYKLAAWNYLLDHLYMVDRYG